MWPAHAVLDTASSSCVQCLGDANCGGGGGNRTHCALDTHQCVQCTTDMQCDGGGQPHCAPDHRCVECLASADCAADEACDTARHVCVPSCKADADCGTASSVCCMAAGNKKRRSARGMIICGVQPPCSPPAF